MSAISERKERKERKAMNYRLLAYVGILLLSTPSCVAGEDNYQSIEGSMLGTTMLITSDSGLSSDEIIAKAVELDSLLKAEMSIFSEESLLSRINRGESDSLTSGLIYNIELADSISRLSEGVYDITVMPLVRAWGFAREDAMKSPNIDSLLEFVGYSKISIDGGRLVKSDPRVQIDLNSIAKGYGVDCLARIIEESGSENYLVDIGGEIRCRGVNPKGSAWRIGIETPFDGNVSNGDYLEAVVTLGSDKELKAMATSGNYRRFYLDSDGGKVSHTIDPRSGLSTSSTLLSVTVVADNCATADAMATMLLAMGDRGAKEMLSKLEGVDAYLIFGEEDGYSHYLTEGMKSRQAN